MRKQANEKGGAVKLTVGQKLVSAVDATTVVVIRCPDEDARVTCGGREMSPEPAAHDPGAPAAGTGPAH
ncbi:hypothetical protein LO772_35070 [Yinghuangia sp. ASG 101]|uniref:hypothetical protein n=1 Tax=Yinghuangia sp. ASG 101 TaxID=2896848 RepID=UPI001E31CB9B|nr:hypothetical protein [Yinghuangia sp. ASG 101]UGQ11923.1 hypothetical protein LO772_35070 [Yinghuangia sp. ASG 101]